tara:strand:- start:507 stop:1934 length:1428 start_codon:yes stop_codon:yes gene_type:complete
MRKIYIITSLISLIILIPIFLVLFNQNTKNFIKDNILVFEKVAELEEALLDASNQLKEVADKNFKLEEIQDIQEQYIFEIQKNKIYDESQFTFYKNMYYREELDGVDIDFKRFTLPMLKNHGPRAYMAIDTNNLFLVTGTGVLMYNSIDNIEEEKFVFKKIKTNFEEIVDPTHQQSKYVVKHILVLDNKIFLSYVKKVKENCYTNIILFSEMKFDEIIWEEYFDTNECQAAFNHQSGGVLADYKDNKLLLTIGDYGSYEEPVQGNNNPQIKEKLVGKIISIDKTTKEYEVLSMGHRNPQGIYYDKVNDVIYSSEHGPQGGDEINVNSSPDDGIKNFGWGVSSYGEHYGFPSDDHVTQKKYELAPLHKSHKDYGFEEPLKFFTPSIAPTQIIKNEKFIKYPDNHVLYLAALGHKYQEGDQSIHQFILDKDLNILRHNILIIYERVRDMVYIERLNKIILFLESTGSIGVLEIAESN